MDYLLDTYALILSLSDPDRLKPEARAALEDPANRIFFSPASIWEIEIKVQSGKLARPDGDVTAAARRQGFGDLPILAEHATTAGRLPLYHRDPFDRMLVAQALREALTVVTPDTLFTPYGVPVLDC